MKIRKGWKITWIAIGSLLGLVVLTVAVALWLVFTPSKLTKIVNSLAGNFITCEAKFGNVDLTLLSTFPDAGLKIEDVVLVNPMEGADSDTLAKIGSLTVGIDIKAFLKEDKVIVHQVKLDDATANLYIDSVGKSNFDIFPKSGKVDTSSSKLPELIDLKKIKVNNLNAIFDDKKDGLSASVKSLDMTVKGKMDGKDIEGDLDLESRMVDFALSGQTGVISHLKFEADGSMNADDIDAKMKLGADRLEYIMRDSTANQSLGTNLDGTAICISGKGKLDDWVGDLKMKVEKGKVKMGEKDMVNETLYMSGEDLLTLDVPYSADLKQMKFTFKESELKIDDYALNVSGDVQLANDSAPLTVDMSLATDGAWKVAPLLAIIPDACNGFKKGMVLDGKVTLATTVKGCVSDSTMPGIAGTITLDNGLFYAPTMLPYKIEKVKASLTTDLYLDKSKASWVKIESLKAHTRGTDVSLCGRVDDLLGDPRVDAKVKGSLPLEDVEPMFPQGMKLTAKGDAALDLNASFKMSQLKKQAYDKVKANGTIKLRNLEVAYDSLHADAKLLDIALQMPSRQKGNMADVHLSLDLENASIMVGVNNAKLDSTILLLSELKLDGSVRLDSTKQNIIKQFNPRFNVVVDNVLLYTPQMPENVRVTEFNMAYSPAALDIRTAKVKMGHSDFELYGKVENLEDWLDHKAMLKGDLNFTSDYADVDQLMSIFSGIGSDRDSLEAMRKEDAVPPEANPFIVPRDVNVTLHTHVKRSIAFGNDLHDVAGALTVNDGRVVLDQMGFVCKAATMQLTALYRSPRPGNLFAAVDFHLLDIQIGELLDMIPAVDTLVPMLSAFNGNANFHLAGESFLDALYRPKMSSLKGAAAISGQNLVVLDNNDLSTIARLMRFKSWKDRDDKIKIDSLSVEMTCIDVGHGCEIEVLPFLLCLGSYQICISGVQQFNNDCAYHLELLKNPLLAKVGVDVKGSLLNPKITLGKVMYADLFRPKRHGVAEKRALEIKNKVRQALEANLKP